MNGSSDPYATDLFVCHGTETHSFLDKWQCDFCREVEEEFEEYMKNLVRDSKSKR